jgi:hypothetical protein
MKEAQISKEDAEEWTQSLGQSASGAYRQILLAIKLKVPKALGYADTQSWVNERLGGYVRTTVEERHRIIKELNGEKLSAEKIAATIGLHSETVRRDMDKLALPRRRHIKKNEGQKAANAESIPAPRPEEVEAKLQEAADSGMEALVWEKIKDRFVPVWIEMIESLDEDERPHLLWAINEYAEKISV